MLAQDRTDLAVQRTSMAAQRTLMAWTRTSLSMISFGFSIFKFMQYMQEQGNAIIKSHRGPRNFGITLIAVGIISLLIACVQYWQIDKKINPSARWHFSLAFLVAMFIVTLGLLALANAIFKIGPF
jgi:putative membrane protein